MFRSIEKPELKILRANDLDGDFKKDTTSKQPNATVWLVCVLCTEKVGRGQKNALTIAPNRTNTKIKLLFIWFVWCGNKLWTFSTWVWASAQQWSSNELNFKCPRCSL